MTLSTLTLTELNAAFWTAQQRVQALFSRGAYSDFTAACADRDAIVTEQRARRAARNAAR